MGAILLLIGLVAVILLTLHLFDANQPQQNATNGSQPDNMSPPVDKNLSNQTENTNETLLPVLQPNEPELTNKTLGELLDDGLGRADSWFSAQYEPADYSIESFRWTLSPSNQTADSIPIKANDLRASVIRFDMHYIDSLRGFAFTVYKPVAIVAPMKIRGTMVFLSNSTSLQNSSGFFIDYDPHPLRTQRMEGCSISSTENFVTEMGNDITIYDFNCKIMYGESP